MAKFIYVGCTQALTVYAQLIIKAQALAHAEASAMSGKLVHPLTTFKDLGVLSGLGAAALAGVSWALAIEKTNLGFAFPFMAFSLVFVPAAASPLFDRPLTAAGPLGLGSIEAGVTINALPL
jgi:hypothetical protein